MSLTTHKSLEFVAFIIVWWMIWASMFISLFHKWFKSLIRFSTVSFRWQCVFYNHLSLGPIHILCLKPCRKREPGHSLSSNDPRCVHSTPKSLRFHLDAAPTRLENCARRAATASQLTCARNMKRALLYKHSQFLSVSDIQYSPTIEVQI